MLRLHAWVVVEVSRRCRVFANEILRDAPERFDELMGVGFRSDFTKFLPQLRAAELELTAKAVERLLMVLSGPTQTQTVQDALRRIDENLADELETRRFLYVPTRAVEYYETPFAGWGAALDNFPIRFDVGEAGKCYALGRHTACVMHLMRVLEEGLKAFARHCGVTWTADVHSWDTIIRRINERIRTIPGERKADQQRLSEISAHLRLAKDAWRDYVMHKPVEYGEETARDIFASVKAFMRDLDKELAERPFPA
jgi:hypothetical protein